MAVFDHISFSSSGRATVFSYFASFEHNIFLMHTHDLICLMDSPYYKWSFIVQSRVENDSPP